MGYKIAIDGPAGSGKSTISKIIAKNNNLLFISTGYFYRSYAYLLQKKNLLNANWKEQKEFLEKQKIVIKDDELFINDICKTKDIKEDKISRLASDLSIKKEIRDFSKVAQQEIASKNDVILDGRDIGTVVMPDANLKIYLTASIKERAKRRVKELDSFSMKANYLSIWFSIFKRDWKDKHRKIAPLKKAKDAFVVKTNKKNIDQVVDEIQKLIKK